MNVIAYTSEPKLHVKVNSPASIEKVSPLLIRQFCCKGDILLAIAKPIFNQTFLTVVVVLDADFYPKSSISNEKETSLAPEA